MHTSITVFTKISLGFSGLSCLLSLRRFSKTTHPTNYRRSRAFVSGQTSTYHGSFKTKSQRAEWQVLASSFLNASVSLASPCSYVSQSSLAGCESLCQRISTRLSSQPQVGALWLQSCFHLSASYSPAHNGFVTSFSLVKIPSLALAQLSLVPFLVQLTGSG